MEPVKEIPLDNHNLSQEEEKQSKKHGSHNQSEKVKLFFHISHSFNPRDFKSITTVNLNNFRIRTIRV